MFERYSATDFARWLRQRRAIRAARAGRLTVSPGDPDFYDADGGPIEHEPGKYIGCLVILMIIVVISFGLLFWVCDPFGGDNDLITAPTVGPSSATTQAGGATTTTMAATTTTRPTVHVPGPVGELLSAFELQQIRNAIILDVLGDIIDSISDNDPGYRGPEIDIARLIISAAAADLNAVNGLFNQSVFECGSSNPLVVCPDNPLAMPAGELLIVAVEHDGIIPTDSTDRSYVYALVLESDGDPVNDWQFNPPFDWDLFRDTDRWYQAIYSHNGGTWEMSVLQLDADGVPQASATSVRVVIMDEWVVWFVPAGEIPDFPGRLRVTAFAHDGSFTVATRGADVSGADPTEPLIDLEAVGEE